jgi:hypothetical protein
MKMIDVPFVGYRIKSRPFEAITRNILLQNIAKYKDFIFRDQCIGSYDHLLSDIEDGKEIDEYDILEADIKEAIYTFIAIEREFDNHKDTYFPGFSALKNLIILPYIDEHKFYVGYIDKGDDNLIQQKKLELEAFKNLCPTRFLKKQPKSKSYTFPFYTKESWMIEGSWSVYREYTTKDYDDDDEDEGNGEEEVPIYDYDYK